MAQRPVVLVHGYSDDASGFAEWRRILIGTTAAPVYDVRVGQYESLANEISIKDIAEGFDRALRLQTGLGNDEPFDAIVHSTGMLVVRAWLTTYPKRKDRLKHLVALAPATWGSPMAHKGRSWLGSVFKGSKNVFKPDFLEAGDEVLFGLELASSFTWDLAHRDLFDDTEVYYGPNGKTPYVFIFCGNRDYGWLKRLVTDPGTDGTVRLAGCSLNSRKVIVDLTERPESPQRARFAPWKGVSEIPVVLIDGLNHGTIKSEPTEELVELVRDALEVKSKGDLDGWLDQARAASKGAMPKKQWQQFVVRMVDERGDAIPDYNVRLYENGREVRQFTDDVHPFARDKSYRCFHVDVTELAKRKLANLTMQLIASSGTRLVGYVGYSSAGMAGPEPTVEVRLDLTPLVTGETVFFYPFTTTVVEIRMNREPLPLGGESQIFRFP